MAKLNKKAQEAAENAQDSFGVIPEGAYVLRLKEVETGGQGAKGEYWTWIWEVVSDVDGDTTHAKSLLWDRISLSSAAAFRVKQVYAALGYTLDSDTDEMIGEQVRAVVTQEEITSGARRGDMGNNIDRYLAADEAQPAAATSQKGRGDDF